MQLIYRGYTYEYDSSKPVGRPFQPAPRLGRAYDLIYRGTTYRVDPDAKRAEVPVEPATYKLIYRAMTYLVHRTAQGDVSILTQSGGTPKTGHLQFLSSSKSFLDIA